MLQCISSYETLAASKKSIHFAFYALRTKALDYRDCGSMLCETGFLRQVSSGCALPKTFIDSLVGVAGPLSGVCDQASGQTGTSN